MKRTLCWVLMVSFLAGGIVPFAYGGEYKSAPPNPVYSSPYQSGSTDGRNAYYEEDDYDSSGPSPEGEFIIFDALILRPLGVISMATGAVGAAVAWPWAESSCSQDRVKHELIDKPFDYTFRRPIGDVDY